MDYAAAILSRLPTTRRGTGFKRLLGKLDYLNQDQLDTIVRAYEVAAQAHEGQRRYSGEAYITHPVLSGPAVQRITESVFRKVFVTDTIPQSPSAAACEKIEVISVAPLFAEAIRAIHFNDSISRLFLDARE